VAATDENSNEESRKQADPIAQLLDRAAIGDLILQYCRGIDRFDRATVEACFHPDATDTHGSFTGTIGEFIDWAFHLLERYDSTMHLVANQLITLSGDRAVSEAYGIAYHRSSNPDPRRNLTVGFRYVDLVERRSDQTWRIAERVATTEWVTAPATTEHWPIPADSAVGTRDHTDPIHVFLARLDDRP
jgi:SnoaL-like domain